MKGYSIFKDFDDIGQEYDEVLSTLELDYTVEKRDATFSDQNENPVVIPDKVAMINTNTDEYIGMVGRNYGIAQNTAQGLALADGLRQLGAKVVGGGPTAGGASACVVLEDEQTLDLGEETIRNEFIVRNTHDGTGRVSVYIVPRSVKHGLVFSFAERPIAFKHTKNVRQMVDKAQTTIKSIKEEWENFSESARKMMKINLADEEARSFIKSVFGEGDKTRSINIRDKVFDLWRHGNIVSALPATRGTLFGLVMAITQYCDDYKTVRKSKRVDEATAKFNAKVLGEAAREKAQAWALALKLKQIKSGVGFNN